MANMIEIDKANAEQLRLFATAVMNLDLDGSETKAQIRSKMQASGYNASTINVPDPETATQAARMDDVKAGTIRTNAAGEEEVRILIPETEGQDGERPVYVSVNGRNIGIPRGEPVYVARKYIHALENASQMVYAKADKGLGTGRLVKRFNFSYVA